VDGVSLAAACLPAEHVGGDYFDFTSSEGSVTALVADVSGHGIGPGLMMAMTRTVLRRELQQGVSLAEAMRATSSLMWDDLAATGLFITVFCVRYEPATRTLRYVNGGHHPALLRRAGGGTARLDGDGWPLGLIPDPDFEELSLVLDPGDAVLLFSDGIVEERSPTGEMFGTERLTALVGATGGPLLTSLLDAARDWRGVAPQQDDVTLLELRVADEEDSG
jgi:sigma-B regulation protein RsbU (phosphoserine phosphatase)